MKNDAPHPSLVNRVARRLRRIRGLAGETLAALQTEAAHPGEPQPHRRGHNPFHRTVADLDAAEAMPSAEYRPGGDSSVDPFARPADDEAAPDDAWYLRDDKEGWSRTNPGDDE